MLVATEDAVAVGDFESAFDADEAALEREETKRLLYVALTRARDRLYLVSATEGGAFRPRKGSLGDVLPASIRELFEHAAAAPDDGATLEWPAATGALHAFRVCVPATAGDRGQPAPFATAVDGEGAATAPPPDDFLPVADGAARARRAVTAPRQTPTGRASAARGVSREEG